MVRYDGSHSDYPTQWACKMCLKFILSEEAVKNHLITCSIQCNRAMPPPQMKKNEVTQYICGYCEKVFQRRVALKKHIESHENSSSSLESEESDIEIEDGSAITEQRKEDDKKPEEQSI
ncbi:unnamed protein product [Macrosiphum euphorbiae]|nr:unnamed protein product [Macrosiphum euphorbiae]